MNTESPRSQRRAYLDWVEEQVEAFKDAVPRGELLDIADQVCTELRATPGGQYQLTELLLWHAVDRHIIRRLKLPGYRAWVAQQKAVAESLIPRDLRLPTDAPTIPAVRIAPVSVEAAAEPLACVV